MAPKWQDEIAPHTPCVDGLDLSAIVDCGYTSFTGAYPADWVATLALSRGLDHRTIICLDPGGNAWQLTALFKSMRPLVQIRDVKFRDYQSQDVDLNFLDPDGVLDPEVAGSILDGVSWKWMQVFVGSWLVGTQTVLGHAVFYLQDVRTEEGITTFRCTDLYGYLSTVYLRADAAENIEITTADSGTLSAVTVVAAFAQFETWTIIFDTVTGFTVFGSLTGEDGSGTTGADFTSDSGSIFISSVAWGGTWVAADTVTFDAISIVPPVAQVPLDLVSILVSLLDNNTDLTYTDILNVPTWAPLQTDFTAAIGRLYLRTRTDVTELIRMVARHYSAAAFPDGVGKISVDYFFPRLGGDLLDRVLCKTANLSSLKSERLPRYSSVTINYDPDDQGRARRSVRYPTSPSPDDAPLSYDLLMYGEDRVSFVLGLAQHLYVQFQQEREIFEMTLLPQDLNVALEDIAWIDSARPNRQVYATVVETSKDLGTLGLRVKMLDSDWIIQPPSSCGYGFCDVGHQTDICWICW